MKFLGWEGAHHRPGGAWWRLIQAGSVAATLWVLWIGALAQVTGNAALWLASEQANYISGATLTIAHIHQAPAGQNGGVTVEAVSEIPLVGTTMAMADDAIAILDGYGLPRAHLVGMSLGGMIAQLAALKEPHRVQSLSLISTSAFDEDDPDLPPMDPALLAHFGKIETLDWNDRDSVVDFQVESFRISAGSNATFDENRARRLAEREYDRALNPQSALNHSMLGGGERWTGRLSEIVAPALVIHGRNDPILSFERGKKLAAKLASARLVALEAGHELNERDWSRIIDEIRLHTA